MKEKTSNTLAILTSETTMSTEEYNTFSANKRFCLHSTASNSLWNRLENYDTTFTTTSSTTSISQPLDALLHLMDLMTQGRFAKALPDMLEWWTTSDCDIIISHGIESYLQNVTNKGSNSLAKHFGLLIKEGLDGRMANQRLLATNRSFEQQDSMELPYTNEPGGIWRYGHYDPEKINVYERRLQITPTTKPPLAFIICYWNSYNTRRLMGKLLPEDNDDNAAHHPCHDIDNAERKTYHLQDWTPKEPPSGVTQPSCFIQTEDGPCISMALMNFIANRNRSTLGHRLSSVLSKAINEFSLQKDAFLQEAHNRFLCSHVETISDDVQEIHNIGNHVIIILPFEGNVWELDSLSGPLYLGPELNDWTQTAQIRLEQWSEAASITKVHNDVHSIILDSE
ncbi:hypothetical protein BGZ49_000073 [Haplosporangium sp. Z 27]|nr:hypothetical protein BGZ49_000073 [Haplosporangium sp. Z 27]